MTQIGVFTFASVYYALRAEKILQTTEITGRLVPVPRILSSCCHGLGLAVNGEDRDKVADLLIGYAIPFEKNVLLSSTDLSDS